MKNILNIFIFLCFQFSFSFLFFLLLNVFSFLFKKNLFVLYRSAKIWWSKAIDCILKKSEGLKSWRELIKEDKKSIHAYKELFERCNVWGCLLVGVLAAKIAK